MSKLHLQKIHGGNKITIPKEIREVLKIKDGDYVAYELDLNRKIAYLYPVTIEPRKY